VTGVALAISSRRLLNWYHKHRRDLPWRHTRDPWKILVSEVMLQQTQVVRVVPAWQRFLEAYPNPKDLAESDPATLHRLWKGLGYPSRADRLQQSARHVVEHGWPQDAQALGNLPGIGPYTSAALACFAFGRNDPPLDINLRRVISRFLGCDENAGEIQRDWARNLMGKEPIAVANALMDLGALLCSKRDPKCSMCPWKLQCRAHATGKKMEVRPPRRPRASRRMLHIAIMVSGGHLGISSQGKMELPILEVPLGSDDRKVLANFLGSAAELLSSRLRRTWRSPAKDGSETEHRLYRCRVLYPEKLSLQGRLVRLSAQDEHRLVFQKEMS
jgi:A/G-specific adenine glycosylase